MRAESCIGICNDMQNLLTDSTSLKHYWHFELWLEHFEKLDSPFVVFGAYFFQVAVSQGLIIPQGVEGFERLDNRLGLVLECAQRYVPNMCAQSQFRSAMAKLHHLVVHGHLRGV